MKIKSMIASFDFRNKMNQLRSLFLGVKTLAKEQIPSRISWRKKLKIALPLLHNKYVLTSILFGVWLGFFDQNNILDRITLSNRISELERQKIHFEKEIIENKEQKEELRSSPEKLEKFAREQYMMKRPHEDLFIILED